MAANDYYTAYPYNRRENAPLPPIPNSSSPTPYGQHQPDRHGVSSTTSPFDDYSYPQYPHPSQQSSQATLHTDSAYYGAGGNPSKPYIDPFTDQNAIPLQSTYNLSKPGVDVTTSPTDAENGYLAEERRKQERQERRKQRRRQGRFKGKISWVVWILTTVQIIVFIVELIRNGMRLVFTDMLSGVG